MQHAMDPSLAINEAAAVLLELATRHDRLAQHGAYEGLLAGCDEADDAATALLDAFAARYFRQVGAAPLDDPLMTP